MADTYVNQDYIDCGFFNAVEITPGVFDRVYSAETMSNPYTRLITDGIFAAREGVEDSDFKVISEGNMDVTIKAGQGIFWSKWFKLTQAQTITVESNDTDYTRIDSIIIEINNNIRMGRVIYRTGEASETPVPPELISTGYIKEYRIANIEVASFATSLDDSVIFDRRGIETPFIASLIQTLSTQELFTQWNQLYSNYFKQTKAEVAAFLRELTEDLTVTMSLQEVFVTTPITETTDTIELDDYNEHADVLFVLVNGIILDSTEYSINNVGNEITLTHEVAPGTNVATRILKAVKAPLPAEGRAF
jgi:hypothetical protein